MALSQQDLDVRLQKIGCCAGAQAKLLAQYYMYGSECKEEQLQKLTILNAYLDILSCYKVQATTDTNWIYVIDLDQIKLLPAGAQIDVFIGGELITSYTTKTTETCNEIGGLNTAILTNSDIISSVNVCNETTKQITVTVPCDMTPAYVKGYYNDGDVDYTSYFPVYVSQEGKCITGDEDNCVTEEQVEVILENIAIMCKECFKPNGFAYY